MARRRLTEKEKLYAKVILDFANAEDTNKAGLQYIKNIQRAFGLPDEFKNGALATFPVQPDAKEFVKSIFTKIEEIKDDILKMGGIITRECGIYSIHYRLPEDIEMKVNPEGTGGSGSVRAYVRLPVDGDEEHCGIYRISEALNQLFQSLCNKIHLKKDDYISDLIRKYKGSYFITVSENCEIIERPILPNEFFPFIDDSRRGRFIKDGLFEILYEQPISYCLVTLLRIDDFRKRLKKCNVCSDFFLSYDGKLRCSENCQEKHKRIYMRDYMKEYPR